MKLLFFIWLNILSITYSGVTLTGTRIIFNEGKKEKTIYFQSKSKIPSIVQVWIDKGDENSTINSPDQSFVITPKIFKMIEYTGQSVRLIFLDTDKIPLNKESLFFLNFMEIPMIKESSLKNSHLYILFKNRVKIFYRPKELIGNSDESINSLIFKIEKNNDKYFLVVNNPSNYYINFNKIEVGNQDSFIFVNDHKMISPQSSEKWIIDFTINKISKVRFSTINDYGAVVNHVKRISEK